MNIRVFLIDDDDASKFPSLKAFVGLLNKTFTNFTFSNGTMVYRGKTIPHSSFLATDGKQMLNILKDDGVLILLDVLMKTEGNTSAAHQLLNEFPDVEERRNAIADTMSAGQSRSPYLLAATILAISEKTLARIAIVSTETTGQQYARLNQLNRPLLTWDSAEWSNNSKMIDELRGLIEFRVMKDVVQFRETWLQIARSASEAQWTVGERKSCELFPAATDYHSIRKHIFDQSTMTANSATLQSKTSKVCSDIIKLKSPTEQIAILKAAARGKQIPIFVVQRILGLEEIDDVAKAISWEDSCGRDAASVFIGLKAVVGAKPHTIDLFVDDSTGSATLTIQLQGNKAQIDGAESALRMGAVSRAALRERKGNPGDLTLGVDLITPNSITRNDGKTTSKLIIQKQFNIQSL